MPQRFSPLSDPKNMFYTVDGRHSFLRNYIAAERRHNELQKLLWSFYGAFACEVPMDMLLLKTEGIIFIAETETEHHAAFAEAKKAIFYVLNTFVIHPYLVTIEDMIEAKRKVKKYCKFINDGIDRSEFFAEL